MFDLIVIGGGAAGLAGAVAAAECGDKVLIMQRMDRIGKKILATGNGRCNLLNNGDLRYPGGADFAAQVLQIMGAWEQRRFWNAHGLRLRQEGDGRVYPACGQATAVLDVLRLSLDACGVEIVTGMDVDSIIPDKKGWRVTAGDKVYRSARVLVAGGGKAQEKLGSNGSCLRLLQDLGIPYIPFQPSLTQIETDPQPIKGLAGIRVRGSIEIRQGKQVIHTETGEILFVEYGISGVCTMQCARYASKGNQVVLRLCNGMGFKDHDDLYLELLRRKTKWKNADAAVLFHGLCVPRIGLALMKAAGIEAKHRYIQDLSDQELHAAAQAADAFALPVRGVKGFANAQVCSGGASCKVFDAATMACQMYQGLHAAGQVLDVDGDCGGFNLMFAFGSGLLAGLNGRDIPWNG